MARKRSPFTLMRAPPDPPPFRPLHRGVLPVTIHRSPNNAPSTRPPPCRVRRYSSHAVAITAAVPTATLVSKSHTFLTSAVGTSEHRIASSVIAQIGRAHV